MLDVLRYPVDQFIVRQQPVFVGCGANIPGLLGVVEQWCIAAPEEWIAVAHSSSAKEQSAFVEVTCDQWIGLLEEDFSEAQLVEAEQSETRQIDPETRWQPVL